MKVNNIFDVAGAIVLLGVIATVVGSPNTARQIQAVGAAFSGSIRAATGK